MTEFAAASTAGLQGGQLSPAECQTASAAGQTPFQAEVAVLSQRRAEYISYTYPQLRGSPICDEDPHNTEL